MSSLYHKYRPTKPSQMVGQPAVMRILKSCGPTGLPHAVMFTGPSGTGKTTMMRMLRGMLGCSDLDYLEANMASTTGVDYVRSIISGLAKLPIGGGECRVLALDEFHQVSKPGQQAILKALEDTPPHVYIFLGTSQPTDVIPAVHTRCLHLEFGAVPDADLLLLVQRVAESENAPIRPDVASLIVDRAEGSPRQALVLLESIIQLPPDEQKESLPLVAASSPEILQLCRAVRARKYLDASAMLSKMTTKDAEGIRRAIYGYACAILKNPRSSEADRVGAADIMRAFAEPSYNNGIGHVHLQLFNYFHPQA